MGSATNSQPITAESLGIMEADLEEAILSWLVELLAEEGAELILLEAGDGGGGRPACV